MKITTFVNNKTLDKKTKTKLNEYITKNNGKQVQIIIDQIDTPLHGAYKYYWGEVLPEFAEKYGDDIYKCHIINKRDFLRIEISHLDEIPKKEFSHGCFMISENDLFHMPDFIPYSSISGCIIIHKENKIIGYIRSTSMQSINYKDFDEYIKKVEFRLNTDVGL